MRARKKTHTVYRDLSTPSHVRTICQERTTSEQAGEVEAREENRLFRSVSSACFLRAVQGWIARPSSTTPPHLRLSPPCSSFSPAKDPSSSLSARQPSILHDGPRRPYQEEEEASRYALTSLSPACLGAPPANLRSLPSFQPFAAFVSH